MKTTSTPAVEWPPGGAPPTRGTASQGRATTDFGALLHQTSARTAPAEGLKRDGDKTSSVAPRDDSRDAAASSRPERPDRPEHPHRTDRPERPERPEHPHAPVAEEAPEQPQGEPVEGEQSAAPQSGTSEQQTGDTVEQLALALPAEVVDAVLPALESAPVVAAVTVEAPVAEAPLTAAPIVGPQPAAQAAAAPVVTAPAVALAAAAPVAPVITTAQPSAAPVADGPFAADPQLVTAQPQHAMQAMQGQPTQGQPAQGQPAQGQPAQGQPAQGQPAQGQPAQVQPQPSEAVAEPVLAERPAQGGQPQMGQQQQASGEQPARAEQPAVAARQQQPAAAPAEVRAQAPVPNGAPVVAPAVNEAQQAARSADAPATRTVRMSPAAEAVENAIRIGQTRGVTHARMSLKPAELGGVEIRLAQTAQGLTATVVADGQQAAQLLQQAGQELRRSLEAQGIHLHQLDISYSGDQREGARSAQAQADGGDGRTSGGADDSVATDGDGLTTTEDITVKETLELPDGVLVDVLA